MEFCYLRPNPAAAWLVGVLMEPHLGPLLFNRKGVWRGRVCCRGELRIRRSQLQCSCGRPVDLGTLLHRWGEAPRAALEAAYAREGVDMLQATLAGAEALELMERTLPELERRRAALED